MRSSGFSRVRIPIKRLKVPRNLPQGLVNRIVNGFGVNLGTRILDALSNEPPIHAVRVNSRRIIYDKLPSSSLIPEKITCPNTTSSSSIESWLRSRLSLSALLTTLVQAGTGSKCNDVINLSVTELSEIIDYSTSVAAIPWNPQAGFFLPFHRPSFHADPLYHASGLYYAQDPSSQLLSIAAPDLFQFDTNHESAPSGSESRFPEKSYGPAILDMCAAPGGKTTMMQQGLVGPGLIVAVELNYPRALRLGEVVSLNADPRGNILVLNCDAAHLVNTLFVDESARLDQQRQVESGFDFILLDAPCSGTALIRREPQALESWSTRLTSERSKAQRELLRSASNLVLKSERTLSRIVYMTCALDAYENDGSLEWARAKVFGERRNQWKKAKHKSINTPFESSVSSDSVHTLSDLSSYDSLKSMANDRFLDVAQTSQGLSSSYDQSWSDLVSINFENTSMKEHQSESFVRPLPLHVLQKNHLQWGIVKTPQGFTSLPSNTPLEGGFMGGFEIGKVVKQDEQQELENFCSSTKNSNPLLHTPPISNESRFGFTKPLKLGDSDYYLALPSLCKLLTETWLNEERVIIPQTDLYETVSATNRISNVHIPSLIAAQSQNPSLVSIFIKVNSSKSSLRNGEKENHLRFSVHVVSSSQLARIHEILSSTVQGPHLQVMELGTQVGELFITCPKQSKKIQDVITSTYQCTVPNCDIKFLPSHSLALCSKHLLVPSRQHLHIPLGLFDAMRTLSKGGMLPPNLENVANEAQFSFEGNEARMDMEQVISICLQSIMTNFCDNTKRLNSTNSIDCFSNTIRSMTLKNDSFPISVSDAVLRASMQLSHLTSTDTPRGSNHIKRVIHSRGVPIPLCNTVMERVVDGTLGEDFSVENHKLHQSLIKKGDTVRLASLDGYPLGWLQRRIVEIPANNSTPSKKTAIWTSLFPSRQHIVKLQLPFVDKEEIKSALHKLNVHSH